MTKGIFLTHTFQFQLTSRLLPSHLVASFSQMLIAYKSPFMIVISAKYFCEVTKNARNDGHLNITKYGKLTFILLQIDGY